MGEILDKNPARLHRESESAGAWAIEVAGLYNEGLSPRVAEEIRDQMKSGDYRRIAGRPWWYSVFTPEELEEAGLL